ncbi:hypothetical protein CDEF62S_05045 [Castellaniella defragrans]
MDTQVLAAMARWPNVPDVYGWLSLSARGTWRLHPGGHDDSPADPITSPQVIAFIGRNYAADAARRWYFQNGPQRVYVQLEAAPWVLHTDQDEAGTLRLITHTGQAYGPATQWWLDETGRLYAQAAQGAGLIEGRDLPRLLEHLRTGAESLSDALERRASLRSLVSDPLQLTLSGDAPCSTESSARGWRSRGAGIRPQPSTRP